MFQRHTSLFDPNLDPDLKAVWYAERGLLDMFQDDTKDLIGFIAECSSADLHQFDVVHGLKSEVPVFRAILAHPQCDRATALNIFWACDPVHYDKKLQDQGKDHLIEDEEDSVFLTIMTEAAKALTTRPAWRGRYKVYAADDWRANPEHSPANLTVFKLPDLALRPTKGEPAESAIIYEYSTIALSFDAWRMRH